MHDIGVFGVQAFDNDGNIFSSLEGLAFRWTVTPQGKSKNTVVLKKVGMDMVMDKTISITGRMKEMEAQNIETHLLPVHGVNTGSVQVNATNPSSPRFPRSLNTLTKAIHTTHTAHHLTAPDQPRR